MHTGNSHKHENPEDSEASVDTHAVLDKGEKGGMRSQNSEVRLGDLQVVAGERNPHARPVLGGQLRNSGARARPADRPPSNHT